MTQNTDNQTRRFLGDDLLWYGGSLELQAYRAQEGGRRIFVFGSGHAVVQLVGPTPDMQETRYEFRVPPDVLERLYRICLQSDLAALEPSRRLGQSGELEQQLCLTRADGIERRIRKWAGVEDTRFEAVFAALLALEQHIEGLTPVYEGFWIRHHTPRRDIWTRLKSYWWQRRHKQRFFRWQYLWQDLRTRALIGFDLLAAQWRLFVIAAVLLLIAFWGVRINPEASYGFGGGVLHGLFWYQNAILSLFTPRLAVAESFNRWPYQLGFFLGLLSAPLLWRGLLGIWSGRGRR